MNRLFSNDLGERILRNADRLKLDFWKADDRLVVNFELSGYTGNVDDDCELTAPADMQFVADLIAQFKKGGA